MARSYLEWREEKAKYEKFKEERREVRYNLQRYGERETVRKVCEEHKCSVPEARYYVNKRR